MLIRGENHVRTIKDHFLQWLDEVRGFKKKYPDLPWLSRVEEVEPEA